MTVNERSMKDAIEINKDYGIFFTPNWVVDLMVGMIKEISENNPFILEPACGTAQFLEGIKRNAFDLFAKSQKYAVEINEKMIKYLKDKEIAKDLHIIHADYLLWETKVRFNLIIGNPPYGIPSLSEHYTIKVDDETKRKYKKMFKTWYGKYNMYGAFIEKSVKLLKDGGQLLFIVPATFMILDEFKKLRVFLAKNGKTHIIYMGSGVFKPIADVTTVILNFIKTKKQNKLLKLSEYKGKREELVKEIDNWSGEIVTFETNFTKWLEKSCSYRLEDIYEVRISSRTPEIKHNPFVVKGNSMKTEANIEENSLIPILNGRNLECNKVIYEPKSGYWIGKEHATELRRFFKEPHIVVGLGFRGKGRVAAAYDEKCYPWMGDVYHLLRKSTIFTHFDMKEEDVVDYLNSDYVSRYIKDAYKGITYHLNITQLKRLPLPTKEEWEKIKRRGIRE